MEAKKLYNSKQVQEERTGDNRAGASTAAAEPAADNMRRVKCDQCDFVALSVRRLVIACHISSFELTKSVWSHDLEYSSNLGVGGMTVTFRAYKCAEVRFT